MQQVLVCCLGVQKICTSSKYVGSEGLLVHSLNLITHQKWRVRLSLFIILYLAAKK